LTGFPFSVIMVAGNQEDFMDYSTTNIKNIALAGHGQT
jgi:hypothetical protein